MLLASSSVAGSNAREPDGDFFIENCYTAPKAVGFQIKGGTVNRAPICVNLYKNDELRGDEQRRRFARDVLIGLTAQPKFLPSQYFYDEKGCAIFEEILALDEYYPASAERQMLPEWGYMVASNLSPDAEWDIVELGVGDGSKSFIILQSLFDQVPNARYVPVDISPSSVRHVSDAVQEILPSLEVVGIVGEFNDSLGYIAGMTQRRKLVYMLGSTIGNFAPDERRMLLRGIWNALSDRDFVSFGFDIVKDPKVLIPAYDDSQGVTARFNLNLLERINRELEGDFDLSGFRHYAVYNPQWRCMESYLLSLREQYVPIKHLGLRVLFEAWEAIHVEFAFKFTVPQIRSMAEENGFRLVTTTVGKHGLFANSLWQVVK